MNKKFLHSTIVVAIIFLVSVSCQKSSIDDSFLEGKWLCPNVTIKHNSDGNITHEWIGAGAMTFDTKNKKVHLYDGCNYSSADYTVWPDSVLTYTGDGMWTEIYCPCSTTPGGEGKIRRLVKDDTEGIELNDGVLKTLLLRPGRWFLRGEWGLDRLQNEEIEGSDITVTFNLEKNLVTLTESGVATFTLPFSTGPDCSISFNISVLEHSPTKLNNTWREISDLLNKTTHYQISAGGGHCSIVFYNNPDNFLFVIERIDEKVKQWENEIRSSINSETTDVAVHRGTP